MKQLFGFLSKRSHGDYDKKMKPIVIHDKMTLCVGELIEHSKHLGAGHLK